MIPSKKPRSYDPFAGFAGQSVALKMLSEGAGAQLAGCPVNTPPLGKEKSRPVQASPDTLRPAKHPSAVMPDGSSPVMHAVKETSKEVEEMRKSGYEGAAGGSGSRTLM